MVSINLDHSILHDLESQWPVASFDIARKVILLGFCRGYHHPIYCNQGKTIHRMDPCRLQVEPCPLLLHLGLPLPTQRVLALTAGPSHTLVDPPQLERAPRLPITTKVSLRVPCFGCRIFFSFFPLPPFIASHMSLLVSRATRPLAPLRPSKKKTTTLQCHNRVRRPTRHTQARRLVITHDRQCHASTMCVHTHNVVMNTWRLLQGGGCGRRGPLFKGEGEK